MHDYNSVLISPLRQGLRYYSNNTNGPSTSVASNSKDEFLIGPWVRCNHFSAGHGKILVCCVCLSNQSIRRGSPYCGYQGHVPFVVKRDKIQHAATRKAFATSRPLSIPGPGESHAKSVTVGHYSIGGIAKTQHRICGCKSSVKEEGMSGRHPHS